MSAQDVKRQIAEAEGFPLEAIDSYVVFIKNQPYITAAGLQYKMHQQYGLGKFAIQGVIPAPEEYALLRRMMGLKEEEPLVVVRGEVWVQGFEKPFMDYGTATPNNLSGFVKFSDYPLEMATRRATNRAMRLATATGMCSADEIKDTEHSGFANGTSASGRSRPPSLASKEQIELIRNLGRNHLLTEEERAGVDEFLSDGPADKRAASQKIEQLKTILEGRRKSKDAGAEKKPSTRDTGDRDHGSTPASENSQSEKGTRGPAFVNENGIKEFISRANKAGLDDEELIQIVASNLGVERLEEIKTSQIGEVYALIEDNRRAKA